MWPVIIGAAVGALVVGRSKPVTRFRKLQLVGTATGHVYEAEELPDAGVLVVRAPGRCLAVFLRKQSGGFVFYQGRGDPNVVNVMIEDVTSRALRSATPND